MKNETKAKIKKILIAIGTGILSIGSFILGILLQDNRRTDGRAETTEDRISDSIRGIEESTKQLHENTERLRETNQRFDRTSQRIDDANSRFDRLFEQIESQKCED